MTLDARWAAKGDDLYWNGYKVHVTETCDPPDPTPPDADPTGGPAGRDPAGRDSGRERPNIITGVATTDATVPDVAMTEHIHAALAGRELLPAEHYLDSGYPSAALVVDSLHRWGVSLVTPLLADQSRQARAGRRVRPGQLHHRLRHPAGHLPAGPDLAPGGTRSPNAAPTPS